MANIVDILVRVTDKATPKIEKLHAELESLNNSGGQLGRTLGIMTGIISSPSLFAPAIAGVGALSSTFASAGAGAVAFGAVAVSSIGRLIKTSEDLQKIQEKIATASTAKEKIKYQQQLERIMSGMNKSERDALTTLQNFKNWWDKFSRSFDTPVFKVFNQGLQLVQNTMTALKPAITTTANVLDGFLGYVNNAFKTDQVKTWFEYINNTVGSNLTAILTGAGNLFSGFFELLKDFAPLSQQMNEGWIGMTASFRQWADSVGNSKGFQTFINYVKVNAPLVLGVIGNIVTFVWNLAVALAPLGTAVMSLVSQFTSWLASSNTVSSALDSLKNVGTFLGQHLDLLKGIVIALVAGLGGLKIILMIASFVTTAINVFNILKTVISAVRTVFALFNLTLLANPITWIILAIVALIAIGVLLYKNWDKVKASASQLWSKIVSVWNSIKSSVSSAISSIISSIKNWAGNFLSSGKALFTAFADGIKRGISNAVSAVSEGMNAIRKYLPFSPAKKGALSDLDKSGEAFFPTWYNGALKQVPSMTRAIGGAMGTMNQELTKGFGSVGLDQFTGGASRATITVEHKHTGSVQVKGDTSSQEVSMIGDGVRSKTEVDFTKGLRQAIRQR